MHAAVTFHAVDVHACTYNYDSINHCVIYTVLFFGLLLTSFPGLPHFIFRIIRGNGVLSTGLGTRLVSKIAIYCFLNLCILL